MKTQADKQTDCKVPWCNRHSQVNDERCAIHSEVHSAYRSASVASDSPNQSNETRADAWLESLMDTGTHFFNGDKLETAKSELEGHRATIYHQWPSRNVETLFVTILECKPRAIRCRWHDWIAGVTREHDLQGANIQNWIIGAKRTDI